MHIASLIKYITILSLCVSLPSLTQTNLWSQVAPRMTSHIISANPSDQELLQLCVCNALQNHGINHPTIDDETIQTIDSLHLCSQIIPQLSQTLAQTHLLHGKLVFAKNCLQISDDLEILHQRQKLLLYLEQHPELIQQLNNQIKSVAFCESALLWHFYPHKKSIILEPKTLAEKLIRFYESIRTTVEGNRFLSEYWQRSKQLAVISLYSLMAYYLYNYKALCRAEQAGWEQYFDELWGKRQYKKTNGLESLYSSIVGYRAAICLVQIINFSLDTKQNFDELHEKQKLLISLRQFLTTIKKIHVLLNNHPEIKHLFPEYDRIQELATYEYTASTPHISEKLRAFLNLLHSPSFTGQASYYFSFQGKIIETYSKFLTIKHELIPLFEALGNIDAQLCTIQLLKNTQAQFCVPVWVESEKPILQSTSFWHPLLDPKIAVSNSIELGNTPQTRNIIITGANAGGKTTAITALMIGQILAQSIGIAPAQKLICTPFTKLHTYLDITTNLAQHESLFMAQANRAEKLQNSIASCTKNQKSLSILDEIFTGTRADFAEHASYEFAKKLSHFPHSICLLATHFSKLTELEKLETFTNYKTADALILEQGTLQYPYKIIPGISTQNIAEHILKNKGILTA